MINRSPTPFSVLRHQDDPNLPYWLPKDYAELEGPQSFYIIGSRGTGKTSLLQALHWRQRLDNPSLEKAIKDRLGRGPWDSRFIGVYFRVQDFSGNHISEWPPRHENMSDARWEEMRGDRFALLVETSALAQLAEAINELRRRGLVHFSPDEEVAWVDRVFEQRDELQTLITRVGTLPLERLSSALRKLFDILHNSAQNNRPVPDEILWLSAGTWLKQVGDALLELVNARVDTNKWRLKICIDDAQGLSPVQQKAVNTLVARRQGVSYVVAFVRGKRDYTTTLDPTLPLTEGRDVVYRKLDQIYSDPPTFRELATEVVRVRVQSVLKGVNVDPAGLLGEYSPEQLALMVQKERVEFQSFQEVGQTRLKPYLPTQEAGVTTDTDTTTLHRYSALLKYCYDANVKCIPHAGWDTILGLSDRSVRDVLNQLDGICKYAGKEFREIIEQGIKPSVQSRGIARASLQKIGTLSDSATDQATQITNLIKGLGEILESLHYHNRYSSVFQVEASANLDSRDRDRVWDILHSAYLNGLLYPETSDGSLSRFRLHRLLGPSLRFIWKASRREIRVREQWLHALVLETKEDKRLHTVDRILYHLCKDRSIKALRPVRQAESEGLEEEQELRQMTIEDLEEPAVSPSGILIPDGGGE